MWQMVTERRKWITESNVGSRIAKMRKTTKRCNKVKSLLYSSFWGNQATQYGVDNEVKCPYSAKDISIDDACSNSSFSLENDSRHKLKRRHDCHFQIQCQLFCVDCEWCDLVMMTGRDFHTQRIYRDKKW